jgi:fucose 4-O-acetylase-like acetyltransferase
MNSQRLQYIDALKGIAIVMVVIGHVELYVLKSPGVITTFVSLLHIPIFMFLAGQMLFKSIESNNSKCQLISGRFRRLIIPFFSFTLLYALLANVSLSTIYFSDYKYGFWFTLSLFNLLLITYLINKISVRKNYLDILLYLAVYLVICSIFYFKVIPYKLDLLFSYKQIVYYYPIIVFGFLVGKYPEFLYEILNKWYVAIFAFICFILCVIIFRVYNLSSLILLIISNLTGFISIHFVFKNYFDKIPFNILLCNLGKRSIEIYMIHFFYILILNEIFDFKVFNHYIVLIVIAFILLLTSYFTGVLTNRFKILRMFLWGTK